VSTQTLTRPEETLQTGANRAAHIIKPQGNKTGAALTTESRVFGVELEALCGHRFVAQHDTKGLPICQACVEAWEARFGAEPNRDGTGPEEA
jgi:hypothetical protein